MEPSSQPTNPEVSNQTINANNVVDPQAEEIVLEDEAETDLVHAALLVFTALFVVAGVGFGVYALLINPEAFKSAPVAQAPLETAATYPSFYDVASVERDYAAKAERDPAVLPDPGTVIGETRNLNEITPEQIERETDLLLALKVSRSPDLATRVAAVYEDINNAMFANGLTLGEYMNASSYPATRRLLDMALGDIEAYAVAEQLDYGVARPVQVEPAIEPVIETPGGPSFPSAVAAQAYLAAFILSDLNPQETNTYQAAAEAVADMTEDAGLQFEMDSLAGGGLAQKYHRTLPTSPVYQQLYFEASKEWAN